MANSRTPAELKNCKLENPCPPFRHLHTGQYLGSDKRLVLSVTGQNGTDKMVWTKWYGQNGIRTKCYWTKWYG